MDVKCFAYVPLYKTVAYEKIRIKDVLKKNTKPKSLEQYKEAQKEYLAKKKIGIREEKRELKKDKYRKQKKPK